MARRPARWEAASEARYILAIIEDPPLLEAWRRELAGNGFEMYGYSSLDEYLRCAPGEDPFCWFVSPELAKELSSFLQRDPSCGSPVLLVSTREQIGNSVYALQAAAIGREQQARDRQIEKRVASLTPREREVLEGVVDGLTNREIGERLRISIRTVESHRANLMDKLRVRSLSALFHAALAYDLVHLADLERSL